MAVPPCPFLLAQPSRFVFLIFSPPNRFSSLFVRLHLYHPSLGLPHHIAHGQLSSARRTATASTSPVAVRATRDTPGLSRPSPPPPSTQARATLSLVPAPHQAPTSTRAARAMRATRAVSWPSTSRPSSTTPAPPSPAPLTPTAPTSLRAAHAMRAIPAPSHPLWGRRFSPAPAPQLLARRSSARAQTSSLGARAFRAARGASLPPLYRPSTRARASAPLTLLLSALEAVVVAAMGLQELVGRRAVSSMAPSPRSPAEARLRYSSVVAAAVAWGG